MMTIARSRPRIARMIWGAVGLLLLSAAGLKAHQLLTMPITGDGLLDQMPFQLAWFAVEVALGLVLLLRPVFPAWAMACLCFSVFCVVTLLRHVAGEASCGCFGAVVVPPLYSFVLDLVVVALLLVSRPERGRSLWRPVAPLVAGATLWLVVVASVVAGALTFEPAAMGDDGRITAAPGALVVLEPGRWQGQPFPLLDHITAAEALQEGRWTTVLYRHDCPACQEHLEPVLDENLARSDDRLAVVELPPYGELAVPQLAHERVVHLRMSTDYDWFVETPTIIRLHEGTVTQVATGGDPLTAQLARAGTDLPRVVVGPDGADLGYLRPGTVRSVLLAWPNPTATAFDIRAVRSECGCMAALLPAQRQITADGTALIPLIFKAPDQQVPYDKRLIVISNLPQRRILPLPVRATVGIPLTVRPDTPTTAALVAGEEQTLTLQVTNHTDTPVRLLFASGQQCHAAVPRAAIAARATIDLPVTVRAKGERDHMRALTITTDCPQQRQVTVGIKVRVFQPE